MRQVSRLDADHRIVLVTGAVPDIPDVPFIVVPGLDYGETLMTGVNPKAAFSLADDIEKAIKTAFPGGCDLLHIHNPLIRKNPNLLGALHELKRRGIPLLLQVHDMAEDFRPEVFDPYFEYPSDCDYATINERDRENLILAGLHPDQVHLLPNPVAADVPFEPRKEPLREQQKGRSLVLYPVRAIRRKNLGETLLLSRFLPNKTQIAVTLPPTNIRDLKCYNFWRHAAREFKAPILFEAGLRDTLPDLYGKSFCGSHHAGNPRCREGDSWNRERLSPKGFGLPWSVPKPADFPRFSSARGLRIGGSGGD